MAMGYSIFDYSVPSGWYDDAYADRQECRTAPNYNSIAE